MYTFITCFICCAAGLILGVFLMKSKPDGTLKVNTSDPDTDHYSLELAIPLDDIPKRSRIVLSVKVNQ